MSPFQHRKLVTKRYIERFTTRLIEILIKLILAEELIEIYEKKGDNENVIKYYKIAYSAKLKPEMIGDGQE